jgi:hypothetical protein
MKNPGGGSFVSPGFSHPASDRALSFIGIAPRCTRDCTGSLRDKHCDPSDPADRRSGSWWDHILLDPQTKLIVTLVMGAASADFTESTSRR